MFAAVLAQQGGIVGGVGQALSISIPDEEEPDRNLYISKKIAIELAEEENDQIKLLRLKRISKLGPPPTHTIIFLGINRYLANHFLVNNRKVFSHEKFSIILVEVLP